MFGVVNGIWNQVLLLKIVYNEAKLFSYEHPLHSFIIDLDDGSLEDQIGQEEFEEIRSFSDGALNKLMPDNLKQILNRLNQKCSSNDIFDEFNSIAAHPAKDPEIFWLKQAVIDYALLFMDQNDSALKLPSTEQDLLEDIYGFIKKSKRLSSTTCISDTKKKEKPPAIMPIFAFIMVVQSLPVWRLDLQMVDRMEPRN